MQEKLKQFVQDNPKLVSMRECGDGIFVLKYKKTVFYDNLWNEFLEECRGTIVDADFNVVSRPFTKIYNYGVEAKAPVVADNVKVTAYRKINGFMIAMTLHKGEMLISTTGSTDNDYVNYAKEMMQLHMPLDWWKLELKAGVTYMFECVHPSDPHIVVEKPGMYFLGARENKWDSKVDGYGEDIAIGWRLRGMGFFKAHLVEHMQTTMGELVALSKTVQHEGFVVYTSTGQSFKIKSPFYLTNKWMARNPRTDKLLTKEFKEQIDEEYYPLLAAIQNDIVSYTAKTEQERLAWIRQFLSAM